MYQLNSDAIKHNKKKMFLVTIVVAQKCFRIVFHWLAYSLRNHLHLHIEINFAAHERETNSPRNIIMNYYATIRFNFKWESVDALLKM